MHGWRHKSDIVKLFLSKASALAATGAMLPQMINFFYTRREPDSAANRLSWQLSRTLQGGYKEKAVDFEPVAGPILLHIALQMSI